MYSSISVKTLFVQNVFIIRQNKKKTKYKSNVDFWMFEISSALPVLSEKNVHGKSGA